MQIPIVLVNNQHPGEFVNSVLIENFAASAEVTNHLIQLGHSRIAYLETASDTSQTWNALADIERPWDVPAFLLSLSWWSTEMESARAEWRGLKPSWASLIRRLQSTDMTALGALRQLHLRKMRVPEDVSLVGFDATIYSLLLTPSRLSLRCDSLAGAWGI